MPPEEIRFSVWTEPIPQGSFIARMMGGKAFAVPSNAGDLQKYRRKVSRAAEVAMTNHFGQWSLFAKTVAIELDLTFYFQRPKSSKRKLPTVKPDIDKLERAVCDALTGSAYEDDSQVTDVHKRKRYAVDEGVEIIIRRADPEAASPLSLPLAAVDNF